MIYDHISDDIPPQISILNMSIPILIHFCVCLSLNSLFHPAPNPTKCDDIKLFQTVLCIAGYTVKNF